MDISLMVALVGLIISVCALLLFGAVDVAQWRGIKALKTMAEAQTKSWEERGDIGEQFGAFLMAREAQDKPTNLQIMATEVGQTLYASLRSGANAVLSGNKRHEDMVENRTLKALEESDPEMKVLKTIFERLDLGDLWNPNDIPSVVNVLRKHGFLGNGSMQSQESKVGWK